MCTLAAREMHVRPRAIAALVLSRARSSPLARARSVISARQQRWFHPCRSLIRALTHALVRVKPSSRSRRVARFARSLARGQLQSAALATAYVLRSCVRPVQSPVRFSVYPFIRSNVRARASRRPTSVSSPASSTPPASLRAAGSLTRPRGLPQRRRLPKTSTRREVRH